LPLPGHDGKGESGDVQDRERDDLAPCKRVTNAPVERIWPVFGEPDDVRPWLDARQAAAQAGECRSDQDGAKPQRHTGVESSLEQIEGERPRRDEEHEDPDRPVIESIVKLVTFADSALGCVFDWNRRHVAPVYSRSAALVNLDSAMPVATARVSESTAGLIGMRTRTSAARSTDGESPAPSVPTSSTSRSGRLVRAKPSSACAGSRGVSA